jgi:ribosome-interacting GTPase 1
MTKQRKDPRQRLGSSQKDKVMTVSIRLNKPQYQVLVDKCKNDGITLSNYIRLTLFKQ